MRSLSVTLSGRDDLFAGPHQAAAVVELRGPSGSLLDRGLLRVNHPPTQLTVGPSGPHEVRVTLPSGDVLAHGFVYEDDALQPVHFNLSAISPREELQRAALIQSMPAATTGDLRTPALVSTWVRLWERVGGMWQLMAPPLDSQECSWYPDSVRYRMLLARRQYVLQVGGPGVPWKLISLPAGGSIDLVFRPLGVEPDHPLELIAVSAKTVADELLGYISRGATPAAARLVADHHELATSLLFEKISDPYAAAVGGYYLLRIGEIEGYTRSWTANLADRMGWMSDGPIIRGWQLLRGAPPKGGETPRERFLQAANRGLPVYTEGLRLLIDGLKVIVRASGSNDDEAQTSLERIGRYGAATDWSRPFLTFTGADPDRPMLTAPIGFADSRDGLLFLYEMTPRDLIGHGLLRPGAPIELNASLRTVPVTSGRVTATITQDGTIRTGEYGPEYVTPAEAALSGLIAAEDAWRSWRSLDGSTLAQLRDRARRHPRATPQTEHVLALGALGLPTRVENQLMHAGVGTIGELLDFTREGLLAIPNVGAKALSEIDDALENRGLSLSPEEPVEESEIQRESLRELGLTEREVEVVALAAKGLVIGDIASRLLVSHATIQRYLRRVNNKLGVDTRADAIALTRRGVGR